MSVARETLILTGGDVGALLTPARCIEAVETALVALAEGRAPAPSILGVHLEHGGYHIKASALLGEDGWFAAKINANYPGNPTKHGLPTIQGVVALHDAGNGRLLALLDSMELTAIRTGAATAVAAKYLARPNASVLAIYGAGRQARAQVECLHSVRPLAAVYCHDRHREAADALTATLRRDLGIAAAALDRDEMRDAAGGTDLIVTCTPSREAFLTRADVAPGTFVAAVGADAPGKRELDAGIMGSAVVVADDLEQCLSIGELQHAIAEGIRRREDVRAELAQVVSGRRPGRTRRDEIIVFDSTGTALQDVAAAAVVYRAAVASRIGLTLDMGGGAGSR
jgi:ornithine cyclodeaminase/alanine dehydrogenase-like protein (mu-crystallin family)